MSPARAARRRAVVFDFDGVLVDTERLHLAAFQDVFARHGWTLDARAYFDRYLGYDDDDLVAAYARDRGLDVPPAERSTLVRQKIGRYADRVAAGIPLAPGAADCIRRLGTDFTLAIASGSLREEIEAILDPTGLRGAFAAIVGADEVAKSKPAPDSYALAADRLAVEPRMAVAVEDSRWGLDSARAAGLRTVGLTSTYPAPALGDADRIVASLDDLTPAFVRAVLEE